MRRPSDTFRLAQQCSSTHEGYLRRHEPYSRVLLRGPELPPVHRQQVMTRSAPPDASRRPAGALARSSAE
eukprot:364448-Chlamydomonas_euryale.AAC.7